MSSGKNEIKVSILKQLTQLNISILLGLILGYSGVASAVPNTFTAGSPILAQEMNDNFTDIENRLAPLAASDNQIVNIDCTVDANTLLNTTITDRTTYVLKGMCNGPIEVWRNRNVIFEGDPAGVAKDDGIILPGGLTENPFAAVGIYESNAELRDLTIDASAYVTNAYPFNATIAAVGVGQHAMARIYDVDIEGGDYGISVYRQSYVKTYDNVRVRNFNLYGVEAWGNSHAEFNNTIEVVGGSSTSSQTPETITAGTNSFVQIKNGGTFTPAGSGSGTENIALGVYDGGVIQIRGGATIISNLNGDVYAVRSGTIRVNANTDLLNPTAIFAGYIGAYDGGKIRIEDSEQTGNIVDSRRTSDVRIQGSIIKGDVSSSDASNVLLQDGSTHSGGNISANRSASIRIDSSTFAGQISAHGTSTIDITSSIRTSSDEIHANENSSILLNGTPIDATNIFINGSSTLRLDNNSNHTGGDIHLNSGSAGQISNSQFSGNIGSNDNSILNIGNSTQIGVGEVTANGGGRVSINNTSISSVSANNGSISFFGANLFNLGTANAFNNSDLFIHDATVSGTLNVSAGGYLHLNTVNQNAAVDIDSHATADFIDSTTGVINANRGAVFTFGEGSFAGATISLGSIASTFGASITGDIFVDGPSSNLRVNPGTGPGDLNGNTIFLCGSSTSSVDAGIAATGLVENILCGPP
ncbi:hypothetical protein N8198_02255 [Gammaproteobacteria bacterium]|nr:hypothetical protein [Gammaproteobacteria bacterium]